MWFSEVFTGTLKLAWRSDSTAVLHNLYNRFPNCVLTVVTRYRHGLTILWCMPAPFEKYIGNINTLVKSPHIIAIWLAQFVEYNHRSYGSTFLKLINDRFMSDVWLTYVWSAPIQCDWKGSIGSQQPQAPSMLVREYVMLQGVWYICPAS